MNNISDKFLDYLQENLNPTEESELFSALTYDDELRSEFRNFISIDKSLRTTAGTFIPPPNVTNAIFSQLGVSSFNMQLGETAAKTVSTSFLKSTLFSSLITGLVSVSATVLLMLGIMNSPDEPVKNNFQKSNLIQNNNETIPVTSSFEGQKSENRIETIDGRENNRSNFINKKHNPDIFAHNDNPFESTDKQDIITAHINENISVLKINKVNENLTALSPSVFILEKKTNSLISDLPDAGYSNKSFLNNENVESGFQLEVNNSAVWNLPQETINPTEFSKLNNLNINILYELSENFSIGAGVKQETFFVKYYGTDNYLRQYINEQQPNLTVFSAIGRFYPAAVYKLKPFVEIELGGCGYGVVFRGGLGSEFLLSENIAAVLSLNYSVLGYFHQAHFNASEKIGFYYGINYKF